jgi:hypothetical protein
MFPSEQDRAWLAKVMMQASRLCGHSRSRPGWPIRRSDGVRDLAAKAIALERGQRRVMDGTESHVKPCRVGMRRSAKTG